MAAILYCWIEFLLIKATTTIIYDTSLNNHHDKNLIQKQSSSPQLEKKEHETNQTDLELYPAFSSNVKVLVEHYTDFEQNPSVIHSKNKRSLIKTNDGKSMRPAKKKKTTATTNKIAAQTKYKYLNRADELISDGSTKWKQSGITVAGDNEGAVYGNARQLRSPYDLAFDSKNQYFYVADYENGRIQRYPVNGSDNRAGVTVLKLNESTAPFPWNPFDTGNKPEAVFVDRNYNIFVCEAHLPRRLLKLSPNGTLTTVIGGEDSILQSCSGIYIDKNENIYVSDWDQHAVLKFDKNGKNGKIVAGGNDYGDASNQLSHPTDVFVAEKTGNIYVADYLNQRIQRWSPGGKVGVTVCGGNGDGDNLNQLNHPWSVVVDSNEKQIYVGDGLNGRVVRWSAGAKKGEIIVGSKNNSSEPNQLSRAGGIGFDANGNLYVTDLEEDRIQKFLIDN